MNDFEKLENFPRWIVLTSNLVSITLYALGFFVLFNLAWLLALFYLVFVFFLELRIIKNHCVGCYYYGKRCGFGKGILSAWFFKQGNPSSFCEKEMTWKDMIPDMMVTLVPLAVGGILFFIRFKFSVLVAIILILLLTTFGNGFVRGSLTCRYCKQKELGCPADKLFNNKPNSKNES